MATTTTATSNFVGTAESFFSLATQFTGTLPKVMRPFPNLIAKRALPLIDATPSTRKWDNDFTPSGTVTYSERYLEPVAFRDDKKFPNDLLDSTWLKLNNLQYPSTSLDPLFVRDMLVTLEETYSFQRDEAILLSDTSVVGPDYLKQYDGLLKLMTNDTDVKSVGNTTITSVNIKNILESLVLELSKNPINMKPRVMFLMSTYDYTLAALKPDLFGTQVGFANTDRMFSTYVKSNYYVIPVDAMPVGKIVVTHQDNLAFGYNDYLRVFKVSNQWAGENSSHNNYTHVTIGWSEGVNYLRGKDIITYGLKAAN